MIDLTSIINALRALIAAIISAFLIPWIRSKTNEQDRVELLRWVEIAVAAAQQLYHQHDGNVRLEYAMALLEDWGFNVDDTTVINAVEAAVLQLHQQLFDADVEALPEGGVDDDC